jgi:putative ABC transport system permease protein
MTRESLVVLGVLVGIVLVGVAWVTVRRPVQRRLAVRDAVRRPGETMLVVVGSLLGTALIAGSFIVGDTLDKSVKQSAYTQLGPIDEVITVPDPSAAATIEERIAAVDDPRIEDVMSMLIAPASIASYSSGEQLAEPGAQLIELDFERAHEFGSDPEITGIAGSTPAGDEAVVTDALAEKLKLSKGDRITAYLYGSKTELQVGSIVEQLGIAGFWTGFESRSPNAFVAPGTIARATETGVPKEAVPPSTVIVVSNKGGVEDAASYSDDVADSIRAELGSEGAARVETSKQDLLRVAKESGDEFSNLFLGIGTFAIIAGILLLVNIFVMLSEERKGQLGMLRAVGMRRSDLVRVFIIEGVIYSLIAGVVGAVLGIGVGWAIVKLAAPIFSSFGDFSLSLAFSAEITSIIGGFFLGFLISMATITFTSVRIGRINIIRAIRDLPDPKARVTRTRTVVASSIAAAAALAWFFGSLGDNGAYLAAILGPTIGAYALIPLVGRIVGRRLAIIASSAFGLFWGILGNTILNGQFFDNGEIWSFVVQGVLLTFSAVVLLSQIQENLEGVIRRVAAPYLSLRLSLAYPLARRFRTGLTLGMYSLVIFTMVFIAVMSNVFGGQVENTTTQEAGSFDILVTASQSNPPSVRQIRSVDGVDRVAAMRHGPLLFLPPSATAEEPEPWPASGIAPEFADIGAPELDEYDEEKYASEEDAWNEVATNPNVTIVPINFLQGGGGPPATIVEIGDVISVVDPVSGAQSQREVIGFTSNDMAFSGAYMSIESIAEASGGRAPVSRFYVQASGSESEVREIATRMQGELLENGVEAESFSSIVEEFLSLNLQFLRLMQAYLALGLIVGIAGLGVVMVRAVRDRRREIGVLRSLGFVPPKVRRAFLLESGFVALEGILIGSILALVTSSQLVANGDFGEGIEFIVPWLQVAVVCTLALIASLFAAAWPAQQASKIAPAVALRVAD